MKIKNDKDFEKKVEEVFNLLVESEGCREEALLRLLQHTVEDVDTINYDTLLSMGSYFENDLKAGKAVNFLKASIALSESIEAKRRAFCVLVTGNSDKALALDLHPMQKSILSVAIMTSALSNNSNSSAEVAMDYIYDHTFSSDKSLFFTLMQDIYDIMDSHARDDDDRQKTWDNFKSICEGKPYEDIVFGLKADDAIH